MRIKANFRIGSWIRNIWVLESKTSHPKTFPGKWWKELVFRRVRVWKGIEAGPDHLSLPFFENFDICDLSSQSLMILTSHKNSRLMNSNIKRSKQHRVRLESSRKRFIAPQLRFLLSMSLKLITWKLRFLKSGRKMCLLEARWSDIGLSSLDFS